MALHPEDLFSSRERDFALLPASAGRQLIAYDGSRTTLTPYDQSLLNFEATNTRPGLITICQNGRYQEMIPLYRAISSPETLM